MRSVAAQQRADFRVLWNIGFVLRRGIPGGVQLSQLLETVYLQSSRFWGNSDGV